MKFTKTYAAIALAIIPLGAFAQSSVTVFGVVDANVRYVKNSGLPSNYSMNNSGLSSGRLGFRGVEDLGGGLKAGFWLESDVNVDTGTTSSTGKFFQRRSTVSLMGNFGELRLGRDFTPASQHTAKFDPFGVIGLAGSNVSSLLRTASPSYYRHDNAIQYFTPVISGFQGEFMFAPDESATNNTGRHMATRLTYGNGPLKLSASYGTTTMNAAGSKLKQAGLAASYNFGMATLMGFYQRDRLPLGTYNNIVAGGEDRFLLGVSVPVGAHEVRASWVRTSAKGGTAQYNSGGANKYAIGYVHNLSRRTALYGTLAFIKNKDTSNFALVGGASGLAPGKSSSGAEFGIRHAF